MDISRDWRVISIKADMFEFIEQRAKANHMPIRNYLSRVVSVYKKAYENKQKQKKELKK